MNKYLMKCGCVAQGVDMDTMEPVCVVHDCREVSKTEIDLSGRYAKCAYYSACKSMEESSFLLAFFEYHPEKEYDYFYCGCFGWD